MNYKKEYKRLKTKEEFRQAVYVTLVFVGIIVYGIMR